MPGSPPLFVVPRARGAPHAAFPGPFVFSSWPRARTRRTCLKTSTTFGPNIVMTLDDDTTAKTMRKDFWTAWSTNQTATRINFTLQQAKQLNAGASPTRRLVGFFLFFCSTNCGGVVGDGGREEEARLKLFNFNCLGSTIMLGG